MGTASQVHAFRQQGKQTLRLKVLPKAWELCCLPRASMEGR